MSERRRIVALAREGDPAVLVTLVRAAGSSYRQRGARLLALADGRTAGTISGGCLEADLLRRAHWRVRDGAAIQAYDTGYDDMAEIPFGLGCGGMVDLLLESTGTPECAALLHALEGTLRGAHGHCVTRLPATDTPLQRVVLDAQGDVAFCSERLRNDEVVALRAVALGRVAEPPSDVFAETLQPPQRLVILGAGEDARPVTEVAAELGWTVVVADGRPQQATAERFPQAHAVRVATSVAEAGIAAEDAVVLMTHSFEQDGRLLRDLLQLQPRYLGLLGARQRSALLLRDAADAAGLSLDEALARTHAPIGLQLGGDGPESIALSIAAEVQAVLQNASGGSRRMSAADARTLLRGFSQTGPAASRCAVDSLNTTADHSTQGANA